MLAHYLPRCYLDAFTAEQRLHVFDRVTGKLRRDTPKNVAVITDYYILKTESGEREERIEHGLLADLETSASPVLRRLANCEPISDDEHDIAATFFAFLCTRIPAFEDTFAELHNHLGQEAFRRAARTPDRAAKFVAEHPKTFPHSAAEFSAFANSEPFTLPIDKRERIRLMIELAEPLIEGFKGMDIDPQLIIASRRFPSRATTVMNVVSPASICLHHPFSPHNQCEEFAKKVSHARVYRSKTIPTVLVWSRLKLPKLVEMSLSLYIL